MDKKMRIIPFKNDIKNVAINFYFFISLCVCLFCYQWLIKGGLNCKFNDLKIQILSLFSLGILFLVIPLYSEIVEPKSSELLLALPIGSLYFLYFRIIRMYIFYSSIIITFFSFIYYTTDKTDFEGNFLDITYILSVVLFLSGLGLFLMLLGKNTIWGFGVPIFLFVYSYIFRGTGLYLWHVCQWIQPKPNFSGDWKIELTLWISGLILHIASGYIINSKEFLIK